MGRIRRYSKTKNRRIKNNTCKKNGRIISNRSKKNRRGGGPKRALRKFYTHPSGEIALVMDSWDYFDRGHQRVNSIAYDKIGVLFITGGQDGSAVEIGDNVRQCHTSWISSAS